MNHTEIIQRVIDRINGNVYLEIGVENGENFNKIKCRNKIGVDPCPIPHSIIKKQYLNLILFNRNIKYFQTTSDRFFYTNNDVFLNKKIDVAFIDGLHNHDQVIRDVYNSLLYLKENGVIILHDCNPTKKEMQIVPRIQNEWTGDVWKSIIYLRSKESSVNVFVLNSDYGLGIITKRRTDDLLNFKHEEIEKMTYEYLDKNRERLLNLKEINYLDEFLKSL